MRRKHIEKLKGDFEFSRDKFFFHTKGDFEERISLRIHPFTEGRKELPKGRKYWTSLAAAFDLLTSKYTSPTYSLLSRVWRIECFQTMSITGATLDGVRWALSFGEPKIKIIGSVVFDSISFSSPSEKSVAATDCAKESICRERWTFLGNISFNDGV